MENAGEIIRRELAMGLEVRIRGLGRFTVSRTMVNMGGPTGNGERKVIGMVRFRPFDALKKAVRDIGASKPEDDTSPVVVTKSETPMSKRVPVKREKAKPASKPTSDEQPSWRKKTSW